MKCCKFGWPGKLAEKYGGFILYILTLLTIIIFFITYGKIQNKSISDKAILGINVGQSIICILFIVFYIHMLCKYHNCCNCEMYSDNNEMNLENLKNTLKEEIIQEVLEHINKDK